MSCQLISVIVLITTARCADGVIAVALICLLGSMFVYAIAVGVSASQPTGFRVRKRTRSSVVLRWVIPELATRGGRPSAAGRDLPPPSVGGKRRCLFRPAGALVVLFVSSFNVWRPSFHGTHHRECVVCSPPRRTSG